MIMKKWLHTAMSSTVSIRMLLQEQPCCGVTCRMPLILGESISSYPGASFASPFSISRYVQTHIQCISYSSCAVISAVQHLQECLKIRFLLLLSPLVFTLSLVTNSVVKSFV
jgi:hypothetical protein